MSLGGFTGSSGGGGGGGRGESRVVVVASSYNTISTAPMGQLIAQPLSFAFVGLMSNIRVH